MIRASVAAVLMCASAQRLTAQTPTGTPTAPIPAGADGAKIYSVTCASCHLANGLGTEGKVPPLAGSEWVTGNEGKLVRIVLHGLIGDVEVQGETFSGAMPTWGGSFSDEQIASVASYIRRSWGNKAAPVTADAVARVRTATKARKAPWTVRELLQAGN